MRVGGQVLRGNEPPLGAHRRGGQRSGDIPEPRRLHQGEALHHPVGEGGEGADQRRGEVAGLHPQVTVKELDGKERPRERGVEGGGQARGQAGVGQGPVLRGSDPPPQAVTEHRHRRLAAEHAAGAELQEAAGDVAELGDHLERHAPLFQ